VAIIKDPASIEGGLVEAEYKERDEKDWENEGKDR
jgi:hypothetical protein